MVLRNLVITASDGSLREVYRPGALRLYGEIDSVGGATGFAVPNAGSDTDEYLYTLPRDKAYKGLIATWQIDEDLNVTFKQPEPHIATIDLPSVDATYNNTQIDARFALVRDKINAILSALENHGVVQPNSVIIVCTPVSIVNSTNGPTTLSLSPATSRVETNHIWPGEPSAKLSAVDPVVVIT